MDISKFRGFSEDQDYSGFAVVRLSNKQMDEFRRGTWVRIESGENVLYRKVRGGRLAKGAIALDYDSRLDLGVDPDAKGDDGYYPIQATIRAANRLERLWALVVHPDERFRIAHQLGLLGVGLGILSLVIAVVSWVAA